MSYPSTPTIVVTCYVIMMVFCFSIVIRVSTRILWFGDLGQWFQLIIVWSQYINTGLESAHEHKCSTKSVIRINVHM